jgi:hypothetical protein
VADLRREVERLRRECNRQQALARAARRTAGAIVGLPEEEKPAGKRQRKPVARGLRAAERLKAENGDGEEGMKE